MIIVLPLIVSRNSFSAQFSAYLLPIYIQYISVNLGVFLRNGFSFLPNFYIFAKMSFVYEHDSGIAKA